MLKVRRLRAKVSWIFVYLKTQSCVWDFLLQLEALKNNEKCFLFHVNSTFCCWDIYIFALAFVYVDKRLGEKPMVNYKIYNVTDVFFLKKALYKVKTTGGHLNIVDSL